jgi:glycosyltransferase involved in cell wall biosynthesis
VNLDGTPAAVSGSLAELGGNVQLSKDIGLDVSVVIPTLNEERTVAACVRALQASLSSTRLSYEIIVADGGSTDATQEILEALPVIALRCPERGRAAQMNHAAEGAQGRYLWFVHSDCEVHPRAAEHLNRAVERDAPYGFFSMTVPEAPVVGTVAWLYSFGRGSLLGVCYGDNAPFVRAEVFRELRGYAPMDYGEDIELTWRLRLKHRRPTCSWLPVRISDRRFGQGPMHYWWSLTSVFFGLAGGVPLGRVKGVYRDEAR